MLKIIPVFFAALVMAACALMTSIQTGKPLSPAGVQADFANAVYLMKAAGCPLADAAQAAAPVVAIAGGPAGEQVLTAVDAAGTIQCKLAVPATALPVPAPANAPPATAAAS